jgi:uncharacterized protein YdaU (DUF1376 family)
MRKKVLPFMPVYPADMLCHPQLGRLPAEAFGAVWRLILHAWLNEAYIPNDHSELQYLAGVQSPKKWRAIWERIEPFFDTLDDEGRTNAELYSLYHEQLEKAIKNKAKASKAAEERWKRESLTTCL